FVVIFSSRRRHTRFSRDWSSVVCSSDLGFTPCAIARSGALRRPDGVRGMVCSASATSVMFLFFHTTRTGAVTRCDDTHCTEWKAIRSPYRGSLSPVFARRRTQGAAVQKVGGRLHLAVQERLDVARQRRPVALVNPHAGGGGVAPQEMRHRAPDDVGGIDGERRLDQLHLHLFRD